MATKISRINSTNNQKLKEIYLNEEIDYVKKRLSVQCIKEGYWFAGEKRVRRLSEDELLAFNTF
jgi:hypothetical protein